MLKSIVRTKSSWISNYKTQKRAFKIQILYYIYLQMEIKEKIEENLTIQKDFEYLK